MRPAPPTQRGGPGGDPDVTPLPRNALLASDGLGADLFDQSLVTGQLCLMEGGQVCTGDIVVTHQAFVGAERLPLLRLEDLSEEIDVELLGFLRHARRRVEGALHEVGTSGNALRRSSVNCTSGLLWPA